MTKRQVLNNLGFLISKRNLGLLVDPDTMDINFFKLRTPVEEDSQRQSPFRTRGASLENRDSSVHSPEIQNTVGQAGAKVEGMPGSYGQGWVSGKVAEPIFEGFGWDRSKTIGVRTPGQLSGDKR